jgi:hypothetical protein
MSNYLTHVKYKEEWVFVSLTLKNRSMEMMGLNLGHNISYPYSTQKNSGLVSALDHDFLPNHASSRNYRSSIRRH